jgi:hypothetical protein
MPEKYDIYLEARQNKVQGGMIHKTRHTLCKGRLTGQ